MKKERAYDLQDRLVDYAVRIIKLSVTLPDTKAEMIKPASQMVPLLQETDELIAILFTSIETAKNSKAR